MAKSALWQRLCVALVLAVGFALVYGVVVTGLNEAWKTIQGTPRVYGWRQLAVLPGGQLVIEDRWIEEGRNRYAYHDLGGAAVEAPAQGEEIHHGAMLWSEAPEFRTPGPGLRARVMLAASTGDEHWYYVAPRAGADGLAYLAGYDTASRRGVGYFGRRGFQTARPEEAEMFEVNAGKSLQGTLFSTWMTTAGSGIQPAHFYLSTRAGLVRIDPRERNMILVVDRTDIVDASQLPETRWSTEAGVVVQALPIVLRTGGSVIVFDAAEETVREYGLPPELRDRILGFLPIDAERAAIELCGTHRHGVPWLDDVLVVNSAGTVLERHAAAIDHRDRNPMPGEGLLAASVFVPAPAMLALVSIVHWMTDLLEAPTWSQLMREAWPAWLVAVAVAVGVAAVLIAWRRLRGMSRREAAAWGAFVFLLGLPGLVGYLLHRRFPRRETIAPPERLGYEVFGSSESA